MNTLVWMVAAIGLAQAMEDLTVLPREGLEPPAPLMLYAHLKAQAQAASQQRRANLDKVKTADDARQWQAARREFFVRQLDGLPPRGKPASRIVGTRSGDGYRVEKVIFESRPGHHVTALLYLPSTPPPYPAVLLACGHADSGKAYEAYQRGSILMARHGLAVLCYDPVSQGERSQLLMADGQRLHHCVNQHTLIGIGCILLGTNTAHYRVHDGMSALDYLLTRKDIDGSRIGVCGNSGGGTESSYLMALDERILAAAPGCYLTTFDRLLDSNGPQDAEQNIAGQIAFGMDQADYVLMRAPRPTLICAGRRDVTFDIRGTWDIFQEGKRFYARFGFSERVDMIDADEPHGFTRPLREATARWMSRWLLGREQAVVEDDLPVATVEETWCTPRGQVLLEPGEKSAFELSRQREAVLAAQRAQRWKSGPKSELLAQVRQVAAIRAARDLPQAEARLVGRLARPGYEIQKWILQQEPGLVVPALAFVPAQPSGPACLYVHGEGKQADVAPGGAIEALVRQGRLVLAVDLPGMGEVECQHAREWYRKLFGPNGREFFVSYMLGRSLVGMNAESILVCRRFLDEFPGRPAQAVHLIGVGRAGIAALHAAALEREQFSALTLRRTLASWADVVATASDAIGPQLTNTVHGALQVYDLPDLVGSLPAGFVTVEEPLRADGSPVR